MPIFGSKKGKMIFGKKLQPRLHLGQGVGVGVGDLTLLGAGGPQVAEEDVDGEVAELAEDEEAEADIGLEEAGGSVQGVVDVVGDVGGEAPVVAA